MTHGTVKWFNAERGFGFIEVEGTEYFVHYKNIVGEGYRSLDDNDKVEFMPNKRDKGNWASEVRVVSDR